MNLSCGNTHGSVSQSVMAGCLRQCHFPCLPIYECTTIVCSGPRLSNTGPLGTYGGLLNAWKWLIQTEICCKYKLYTWFWNLRPAKRMWNVSLMTFFLFWSHVGKILFWINWVKSGININFACYFFNVAVRIFWLHVLSAFVAHVYFSWTDGLHLQELLFIPILHSHKMLGVVLGP